MIVSYQIIRRWCLKFGASFADNLRLRRPRPGDKWHLDEVFIRIYGDLHDLWRAVDQDGVVLDILVQSRRNAEAAKRFFKRPAADDLSGVSPGSVRTSCGWAESRTAPANLPSAPSTGSASGRTFSCSHWCACSRRRHRYTSRAC